MPRNTAWLECSHRIGFDFAPPTEGQIIWCPRCHDMIRVRLLQGPWRGKCIHCYGFNAHGVEREAVAAAAQAHAYTYHHVVYVWTPGESPTLYRTDAVGGRVAK